MILKNRIKKIIDAIKDTDISEIEISSFWGSQKIKMKRNNSNEFINNENQPLKQNIDKESKTKIYNMQQFKSNDLEEETVLSEEIHDDNVEENDDNYEIITAPLVGTFYLSPKPGDPPFVKINDVVKNGDTICIVEAMKIFNEIESEHEGKIIEILVNDSDPVEYDQPLFKIKKI